MGLFCEMESTQGFLNLVDAPADIKVFTSTILQVDIWIENNDAEIIITNGQGVDQPKFLLRSGSFYSLDMRANRVRGNNAVAGLVAKAQVVGYR